MESLKTVFGHMRAAIERRRTIEQLSRLTDAQLRDIGVERGAIDDLFAAPLPGRALDGTRLARGSRAFA